MNRSYVVTFAFVVFRALFLALQAAEVGTFAGAATARWSFWNGASKAVLPRRSVPACRPSRRATVRPAHGARDADLRISRRPA